MATPVLTGGPLPNTAPATGAGAPVTLWVRSTGCGSSSASAVDASASITAPARSTIAGPRRAVRRGRSPMVRPFVGCEPSARTPPHAPSNPIFGGCFGAHRRQTAGRLARAVWVVKSTCVEADVSVSGCLCATALRRPHDRRQGVQHGGIVARAGPRSQLVKGLAAPLLLPVVVASKRDREIRLGGQQDASSQWDALAGEAVWVAAAV